jgi:hypothetical protein
LNWIDGGDKDSRLSADEFERRLEKAIGSLGKKEE